MLILFVNMGNNMSKNKINNNDFITTKINKLLSQLETQVEQVFGEFSEEELKELLDNDLGEIIFNFEPLEFRVILYFASLHFFLHFSHKSRTI